MINIIATANENDFFVEIYGTVVDLIIHNHIFNYPQQLSAKKYLKRTRKFRSLQRVTV